MVNDPGRRFFEDEEGFTLTEMLVAMTMMMIVTFALYGLFDMSLKVYSFGGDKVEAVENARAAMERMSREIRSAYPNGGILVASPAYPSSSQIGFTNGPGGESVVYSLSAGSAVSGCSGCRTLMRNGDPVTEYVDGSKGLTFTYLQSVDPEVPSTNGTDVRAVKITLNVIVPGVQAGRQSLTTYVDLRNASDQ
ncbi:PilW family protein [Rubrobacter calidifluminis]|uniref:PilW family protein n=1 Tax=Rubrobacter calidifluminis TaxID=1392640 RepID=UPI00235E2B3E|nr:prepilin-type N-terminal cleavage/methylation domain-containing protein [Rubrobacter calidifluminis]